ncbi:MAG: CRTAC1 family protein [Blastocatellia bacterium]
MTLLVIRPGLLWLLIAALSAITVLAQTRKPAPPRATATPAPIRFTHVTQAAGIGFVNASAPDKRYIVESMSGGVAMFDYDNDGWLDIYLLNSFSVAGARGGGPRPHAALYRNLGNGRFADVTAKSGLGDPGWTMGLAIADYDNDGWDDVYVTCYGPSRLYRNRGDGTFADVTDKAGVGVDRFSTGAAWGDYDHDGDVDLFVAGYVAFDLNALPDFGKGQYCLFRGIQVQCGPRGRKGAGDTLYRNNGDGTFNDVSKQARVDDANGYYGLGVVWTDLDSDGWVDLFVANDTTPNYAYRNNRDGTFTDIGFTSGLAVDESGREQACMGVTIGDYDRDGRLDMAVSNFAEEYNTLYHHNADGTFSDQTRGTRTAEASLPYVGWGLRFFDADLDGWLDLFVANGHVYPQVEGAYAGGQYGQRKLLYRNLRNGQFAEMAHETGEALLRRRVSRGAAFGDYDEDGDLDMIVNELDGAPTLLRNDSNAPGAWVKLNLVATKGHRQAGGARVKLTAAGLTLVDEARSGDTYLSHSDRRLHFGLGAARVIATLEIRWPDGAVERMQNLPVRQTLTITQGKGWKAEAPRGAGKP